MNVCFATSTMAASCLGYLIIVFVLTFFVRGIDGNGNQFCREQEKVFHSCSTRMEFIYLARSQSLDILCKEIAQYLSCVHETNVSCPEMPIFQDRSYTEAIQNTIISLNRFCKGYSIATKCNNKFVNHLVSKCTTILNKVQVDTHRDDMCRYSKEYLACLQQATEVCRNNPSEFLFLNVPLAIASTETALPAVCDDIQGDSPWSPEIEYKVTIHPLCSGETIHSEAQKCMAHTEHPPEVMDTNGCRHQQLFVSCLDHLLRNCPNGEGNYKSMLTQAQDTFSVLCSDFTCPKEIENGEEDVVSYCMLNFYAVDPSNANYCRKLQIVPECIENVRTLCPPTLSLFRLNEALTMIDTILEDNCEFAVTSQDETFQTNEFTEMTTTTNTSIF